MIEVRSLVRLKSGGPLLEVTGIRRRTPTSMTCTWYDGEVKMLAAYHEWVLEPIKELFLSDLVEIIL